MTSEPNLQLLKPSRVAPQVGDVFTYLMPDGAYRFGRVISTSAAYASGAEGGILVYLYRGSRDSPAMPDRSMRDPNDLLVAPAITNRLGWARGYFQTIGNVALEPGDVLRQHCFEDSNGRFFDEMSNPLGHRSEPCGGHVLHSYRSIDDLLSRTLGIALAPV